MGSSTQRSQRSSRQYPPFVRFEAAGEDGDEELFGDGSAVEEAPGTPRGEQDAAVDPYSPTDPPTPGSARMDEDSADEAARGAVIGAVSTEKIRARRRRGRGRAKPWRPSTPEEWFVAKLAHDLGADAKATRAFAGGPAS